MRQYEIADLIGAGGMGQVYRATAAQGLRAGSPFVVLHVPDLVPNDEWLYRSSYAPSRDGRRFLVEVLAPGVRQPPLLQVIVNWPVLLDRR